MEEAVIHAANHLWSCYQCLSHEAFSAQTLAHHSMKFAAMIVALEMYDSSLFRVKPKLHLFQEMAEMQGSNPSDTWCYRDEEFGGSIAGTGRRRGGANSPMAQGRLVLNRFRAKHALPIFV